MFAAGPESSSLIEALLNPGDSLLVEEPTYSGSLAFLRPLGVGLVGVPTDEGGLVPAGLDKVLAEWHATHPGRPKPRVLYTIPNGSNPTGNQILIQVLLYGLT